MLLRGGRRAMVPAPRVAVGRVEFDALTVGAASALVRDGLARGCGGVMVVVGRESAAPAHRAGTVVLAGSATTVWASRLSGRALPQRVRPGRLAEALCGVAAADGRRVFLVGGAPGGPGVPSGAQRAAAVLGLRFRGLYVAGGVGPPATGTTTAWSDGLDDVVEAKPDLVLVSTHGEAQRRILTALRAALPGAWLVGCAGIVDALVSPGPAGARRWLSRRTPTD